MNLKTRLAPSPTGALHLGNARTFLINAALARRNDWTTLLRIEDLDTPRTRIHAAQQAIEDLAWLGLTWDEGPVYQTPRTHQYDAALLNLLASGHAYYCTCSRRDVETAASAPHAADGSAVYPGTCRGRYASAGDAYQHTGPERAPAVRFKVPPGQFTFHDGFAGVQNFDLERGLGDFVIARMPPGNAMGQTPQAAYQLAVVVDDFQQQVTHVVRADDLLDSTPRQLLIYEALGQQAVAPAYVHLPLVVGPDGRRLAKRHGDTRLSAYREAGVPPEAVIGLVATWCGIAPEATPMSFPAFADRFDLAKLPPGPAVATAADYRRLLSFVA
ncbi:MAG: tRNA glutamyl-Q(34) synthetase GluQRS [Phycisphaerae bacterium]